MTETYKAGLYEFVKEYYSATNLENFNFTGWENESAIKIDDMYRRLAHTKDDLIIRYCKIVLYVFLK